MNEVSTAAIGRQPMTLADVRAFLGRCEAMGIPDGAELHAVVSLTGKVKKLAAREVPGARGGRG